MENSEISRLFPTPCFGLKKDWQKGKEIINDNREIGRGKGGMPFLTRKCLGHRNPYLKRRS
jgi:hypothetical protein